MALQSVILGNGYNAVYTSNGANGLSVMYLCNTSPNTVTFNLYAVPAGGVPDVNNIFYFDVEIKPKDTYVIDTEKLVFNNNDAIHATSSEPNVVVVTVSTMEL